MSSQDRLPFLSRAEAAALFVAGISIAGACWYQATTYINPDIGWLLHLARSSAKGAVLYKDLIEINPPLVVWLMYLVVYLSGLSGAPLTVVFSLAIGILALGAMLCSVWLLAPEERWPALPLLAIVCFVVPGGEFGQREHLLILFLLPFLSLAVRRVRGGIVSTWMALLIGFAAASGLALKPHFGLIWIGTAVYLSRRLRLRRFLCLPETVTAISAAPIYILAITLFTPAYWTVVRQLGPLYFDFVSNPAWILLLRPPAIAVLFCVGLWAVARWRSDNRLVSEILGIAAVGALLGAVAQGKVFGYHYLPALIFGVLLAISLMGHRVILTIAAIVLLVLPGRIIYQQLSSEWRALSRGTGPRSHFETRLTSSVKPGDRVLMLLWRVGDSWPVALQLGSGYIYPMPSIWWVRALYPLEGRGPGQLPYRTPDEMDASEHFLFDLTVSTLIDSCPKFLVLPREPGIYPAPKCRTVRTLVSSTTSLRTCAQRISSRNMISKQSLHGGASGAGGTVALPCSWTSDVAHLPSDSYSHAVARKQGLDIWSESRLAPQYRPQRRTATPESRLSLHLRPLESRSTSKCCERNPLPRPGGEE